MTRTKYTLALLVTLAALVGAAATRPPVASAALYPHATPNAVRYAAVMPHAVRYAAVAPDARRRVVAPDGFRWGSVELIVRRHAPAASSRF
ncbi:MAG: hypothetical protein ACRDN6_07485 [Gaiellaceae bacterium]